jgi:hypothetical protein
VPGPEFVFALELSDEPYFEDMLTELAGSVLAHVGYEPPAIEKLRAVVRGALAQGATDGRRRCDVRFRAESGQLHITVGYAGAAEWRTTQPLP